MDIQECLEKRYLIKEEVRKDLIDKEIKECNYDLGKAKETFSSGDHKWSIVQCYYSMFHSAKAVCFKQGYREKRHFAVLIVLEDLNKKGKLEVRFVNDFGAAISAREGADYRYAYSEERAEQSLKMAEEFNKRMKELLKNNL